MKKKIIVLLSVLVFALGMFIACGNPSSESTGASTSESVSISAPDSSSNSDKESVSESASASESDSESERESDSESESESDSESESVHTHAYAFDSWVTAPTLEAEGKAKMKCDCGEETEKDVPALGDTTVWTKGADVEDPCVGGEVEYTSADYDTVKVTVAPAHDFGDLVPAKAATCKAEGNVEYKQCEVCKKYFDAEGNVLETIVTAKLAHTPAAAVEENKVAATCTVDGSYDAVVYCSVCGEEVSRDTKTIPATGHTYETDEEIGKEATCYAEGTKLVVEYCTVCEYVNRSDLFIIPVTDHVFKDGYCESCHLSASYSAANVNLWGTVSAYGNAIAEFNAKGEAVDNIIRGNSSYYSDSTLNFAWVDYASGKIKITVTYKNASSSSGGSGDDGDYEGYALDNGIATYADDFVTDVFYGYFDKTSGIFIINFAKDKETLDVSNYVFVPATEVVSADSIVSSELGNNNPKAMTVTIPNGSAVSVIIFDGKAVFGVTFVDLNGNALGAKDLKNTVPAFIAINGDGEVVAYGSKDGAVAKLDGVHGIYDGTEGTLVLDGLGSATLGDKAGAYEVNGDVINVTITVDGKVTEYYEITLADGSYTAVKPMVTVYFATGDGHDNKDSVRVNMNTVFNVDEHKLANTDTELFKGWMLGEDMVSGEIVVSADTTLTAVWATKVTINITDTVNGNETLYAGVGDDLLGVLAAHNTESETKAFIRYDVVIDGESNEIEEGTEIPEDYTVLEVVAVYEADIVVNVHPGMGIAESTASISKNTVVKTYLDENYAYTSCVDGYKFDGWYTDAALTIELADDLVISDSLTDVYGKWSWAGNVKFTEYSKYAFAYVPEKNAWKSTNEGQGGTSSVMEIVVTSGVAEIEFDYWVTSEKGYDYVTIYYYDESNKRVELKTKGTNIEEANAAHLYSKLIYTGDTDIALRISYSKDGSGDQGVDAVYVVNLKINGISIFAQAPLNPDAAGVFTAADGTVVKTTAGGGVTVGKETVPYTTVSENVIGVTLAAGYREITLNKADNTCVIAVPQVKVAYNYGGHGDNTEVSVDKFSSQTVTSEVPTAEGFIFRGWYKEAEFVNKVSAGSSFTADSDITFYAKWDKAITVTYKYEDDGAHADETDTSLYANDTVTVKAVDFKFGEKVFAGWFTKNADGEFDTQITTGTALTDDTVLYAKWVDVSPFYGDWTVVRVSDSGYVSVYSSSTTKISVDFFGNAAITGYNGFSNGNKVTFAFVEGSSSVLEVTCVTSYSTNKYYAIFDADARIIARSDNSANFNTNNYVYFMLPYDSSYATGDFAVYAFNANGYNRILAFTDKVSGEARSVFAASTDLYTNASFKDFDGNAIAVADLKNALNIFVYNGETLVAEYANKGNSAFVTTIDTLKGHYDGADGDLFLNGAGVAKLGDKTGTYALQEGSETVLDVYLDNKAIYKEVTVDVADKTYVATVPTVTITYNYMGHGDENVVTVTKNVSYKVPTDKPTDSGFIFRGWFEDEALTNAAKSSYVPTENIILYAKWDEAVVLTFDYNGQGTAAVVVPDKYVGDKVSGIPTVAADVTFNGKSFAGWFIKNEDGTFGDEASTSTVLEGNTTYYAKWVDAPQSVGTFKGWNMDDPTEEGTKESSSLSSQYFKVEVNGAYTHDHGSGTLTDEQAAITDGYMILNDCYIYFNKELGLVWRAWGKNGSGVGNDTRIGVNVDLVKSVSYSGFKGDEGSYIAYFEITYKDNTVKTAFLYNSIIVANATWGDGVSAIAANKADRTVSVNGVAIAKVEGKKVLGNDGLAGTYTGDYGEIVVDGYGSLTLGENTVSYTIVEGRTIKFVSANAMREILVDLGNGTYTKVLDGYQGTYTLPDGSTIVLDGFGGAGEGKTYVVNGSNITIFEGDSSVTYGLDVENNAFLGKSLLAGCVFTGKTKDNSLTITFDDAVDYAGTILIGTTSAGLTLKFTATFDGTTLVITIVKENSVSYNNGTSWSTDSYYGGKVTTMVLSGNKLTVTETQITMYYPLTEGVATCEGFSL